MFGQPSTLVRKSVPEQRQAQRLSKPRTNTSSSDLPVLADQQSEPNSPLTPLKTTVSFGEGETVVTSQLGEPLERRSRRSSRHKLRAHLFGSSPDLAQHELSEASEEGARGGIADVARGVRDRLSRTTSIVSQLPSTRGSFTHLNNSFGASRLSLAPEPIMPDLEETTRIVEEIKEKASNDRLAAYNHVSSPVDEDAPEFIMSPIRRRSLFTPGLATRTPTDILRKPPPPKGLQSQADRDYYFDPSLPQSSPLSRLAALDLADEGRCTPVQRASTPLNLDYTYLGGLRIGTLRVTNGTDSPKPYARTSSITSRRSTPELKKEEDYFTASEGKLSDDEEIQPIFKEFPRRSCDFIEMAGEPISVDRRSDDVGKLGRPALNLQTTPQRSGSPLKYEHYEQGVCSKEDVSDKPCRISPSEKRWSRTCDEASMISSDRASSIAQEYMLVLPDSPFSYPKSPRTRSPKLEATSKAFEFDDDQVFVDEGIAASAVQGAEVTKWNSFIEDAEARHAISESREEAFNILNGEPRPAVPSVSRFNTSSATFGNHDDANTVPELSGKPLTKADSGYSSNGSVKSGRKGTSSSLGEQNLRSPNEMSHSAMPNADCGSHSQINTTTPKSILVRPSLVIVPKPLVMEPTPASTTQASSEPNKIMGSSWTSATTSSVKPRKFLKKPRPSSAPLPVSSITVQGCCELIQLHIPPVPSELAARHAERVQDFPLLEHTFPSLHHTHFENISPSSEPDIIPIRFPSPAHAFEDSPPSSPDDHLLCMSNVSWKPRPRPQRDYTSTNTSKTKARPRQQRLPGQCDFESTMAEFSGVTKLLGGSPYEVARSSSATEFETTSNGYVSFPQHTTTPLPRSRSNFGMDGEAASEFARVRSKQKSRTFSRTRTLHHGSFDDRGGIPGKLARPRSCIARAPPVPALPIGDQVEQKGRLVSRSSADGSRVSTSPCQPMRLPGIPNEETLQRVVNPSDDQFAAQFEKSLKPSRRPASLSSQARNPVDGIVVPPPLPADWLSPKPGVKETQPAFRRLSEGSQHPTVNKQASRSFHLPMTPPESPPSSTNTSTTSLQVPGAKGRHVVGPTASFERLSGRYDGGLSFGYEPGFGLGGSAGTRGVKAGASRKSVEVSRGFGIDLSDVPIFVAPYSGT
ncbi:hypothetical protein MMC08_001168 [Hypocenomyce scalaris]|nr:hypothetical protein [Hypocenomyce scalaris]